MAQLPSDSADKQVGQRIQMRRKELGMTAQHLAELVDISHQQLSRYERGTNKINVAHLVNIAVKLNTPISWFFIDCFSTFENDDQKQQDFAPVKDADLKSRLDNIWPRLTHEQRRILIMFLDKYTKQ
ncbi:helix-turn-helix transcriptional regulator [Salmonella enterica subsp. enterica serovar Infantis]|uniref:helix-turn-helix domain-containing protein n=1 Tax=Enterobacterales TaxID=91347 RepID=UPI00127ABB74|nr:MULTISPECIES: helix-turn-helix transcriptional regulator [Enterobacterales]EAX8429753.1 helix-turn-helix transcriptional regulator [Salmonella enterica]EDB0276752.1 helix-turn-helix transcriptional regulator [Salmonella enterica subsp. enterica serovar Mbandaka]EDW7942482.1 helix-turn-helix transcriptional regulator [Salmonella enterica subsp. enterica serovar Ruiru]EGS8803442.1 helix-turn-helix transcriptional regulator [Salmonella enterica subsp. enterica serovar Infantis]HBK6102088.1 hel